VDPFSLDGGLAVVTGASRGLGKEIAFRLAEAGCDVAVTARRQDKLDWVARQVEERGRRAIAIPGDITDRAFVKQLATIVAAELGAPTVWVNNAGGTDHPAPRPVSEMPDEQWDHQLELNLSTVFTCAREASKVMASSGSIINISSRAATRGAPNNAPYAAAKAAVDSLTKTLALELAPSIRVNGVAPGPVPTKVLKRYYDVDDEGLPALAKEWGIPLERFGTPSDIACAVVYLASPAANWITGQTLHIDGGSV